MHFGLVYIVVCSDKIKLKIVTPFIQNNCELEILEYCFSV